MNYDELLAPWTGEVPVPVSERLHTPWAIGDWHAWNEHAVEVEVANFVAQLAFRVDGDAPNGAVILETGTGQGYLTRAVASSAPLASILVYESDPEWRLKLIEREHVRHPAVLSYAATPDSHTMSTADLVLLDSMDPFRLAELCLWAAVAKPGSILWIHDAGNGHPAWDGHFTLGQLIRTLKLPGKFLENPRGSFIAVQDATDVPAWILELWDQTLIQTGMLHKS
jgi:hypothetical protein